MDYEKIGEKRIINGETYYNQGYSGDGFIFKDEEAFCNRPDDVCYIPEHSFDDLEPTKVDGIYFYKGDELDKFTRRDLEKMLLTDDAKSLFKDPVSVEFFFESLS